MILKVPQNGGFRRRGSAAFTNQFSIGRYLKIRRAGKELVVKSKVKN
jgi:hypothetical protein